MRKFQLGMVHNYYEKGRVNNKIELLNNKV